MFSETVPEAVAALLFVLCMPGCGSNAVQEDAEAPPAMVTVDAPPRAPENAPAERTSKRARPGVPEGYVELKVEEVSVVDDSFVVILMDEARAVALQIFIGGTEALSIELRYKKRQYPRPLTHDLLDRVMRELGGELVKIHIDDIRDNTFIGAVFVRRGDRIIEVDARPSDAIALALGNRVPIYVSKRVLDQAGVRPNEALPGNPTPGPQPI
jgi:bifunctional DNase/RNase